MRGATLAPRPARVVFQAPCLPHSSTFSPMGTAQAGALGPLTREVPALPGCPPQASPCCEACSKAPRARGAGSLAGPVGTRVLRSVAAPASEPGTSPHHSGFCTVAAGDKRFNPFPRAPLGPSLSSLKLTTWPPALDLLPSWLPHPLRAPGRQQVGAHFSVGKLSLCLP